MSSSRQNVTFIIFVLCVIIIFWMLHYANSITHQMQLSPPSPSSRNKYHQNSDDESSLRSTKTTQIPEDDDDSQGSDGSTSSGSGLSSSRKTIKKFTAKKQQQKNKKSISASSSTFPKFTLPPGLEEVALNDYAYHASTHWWFSNAVIEFHRALRTEAQKLLNNISHSSATSCGGTSSSTSSTNTVIKNKYYYTHRKPRPKELGNIQMSLVTKSIASKFISIGEPLHRVVNPEPVQLNNSFDFRTKKFGNWHVTFVPEPKTARSSPQRVPAEPAMSVALFQHAIVSYGNVVTCDGNHMFTTGGCLWEGPGHGAVSSSSSTKHHESKNIIAIAMCDGWCRGYYHFSHEHLPRIAMVHDLLMQNPHARLVLSNSPVSFAKQFYTDILGIPTEKIMIAGGSGLKAGVVAYPTPMRCGNAFTSALVGLRRIVLAKVVPQFHPHHLGVKVKREDLEDVEENEFPPTYTRHAGKIRILFAERSKLSRMPRNWENLKTYLKEEFDNVAEFEETQGREHAREQVLRFYRADVVVGPHGANLANIMFMRPGRHVLEMASAKNGNLCYYSTAMRVNLTHHLVLHDKGKDAHYTLRKEILRDHLQYAIDRVKDLPP